MMYAIAFFISCLAASVSSQPYNYDHPSSSLCTLWTNAFNSSKLEKPLFDPREAYTLRPILITALPREDHWSPYSTLSYVCGFYCSGVSCDSYLFSISIVHIYDENGPFFHGTPQVVWSANRNNPVGENATVELTNGGQLILNDADGAIVWSSNTAGKTVASLNLTEMGNLVMFDANHSVVWQSFDYPTDSLLVGQILPFGKNLTAADSPTNSSAGSHSVSLRNTGLVASVKSNPPLVYSNVSLSRSGLIGEDGYIEFRKGRLVLHENLSRSTDSNETVLQIPSTATQYMKLEHDGHLVVYEWDEYWKKVVNILSGDLNECIYPMTCGSYGICSKGQCSCPSYDFRQINDRRPDLGCSARSPVTCDPSENVYHDFLDLNNVTYFTFVSDFRKIDINACKEECLRNCSCKAAMFRYWSNSSEGDCYLPTEIFSLMENENGLTYYNSSVSLKMMIAPTYSDGETIRTTANGRVNLLGPTLGSILVTTFLTGTAVFVYSWRKRMKYEDVEVEEDYLDHVTCLSTRFSFQELAAATDDFSNKLGEGGFGSVYEGSLNDGTWIAVKRLDGVRQIKKSFLAEVESIGSIHHINLVRLIGFCAENSHRLLVYEYMCNGSLEKWIYSNNHERSLDWSKRRKIITDIAKGLAYLHEDCRQKILHLDIKPQNILLDEHYNAKLADFGLSKLIDRNQSQVVTTMRGMPGYLAPEWLKAIITEKLDIYSFGVVVLEILTGRKIFEGSRPEEERYLLSLFKTKAEDGQWLDLVNECCEDEGCDLTEVEKMMKISAWCLQSDHEKRPSMSMVMKVMEGAKVVPEEIDCSLLIPRYLISRTYETISSKDVTPLIPSLLSGPR